MTDLVNTPEKNWKTRVLLVGTLAGAALGFLTAYLMARTAEENGGDLKIETGDILRMSLAVITTVRSVAALGSPNKT